MVRLDGSKIKKNPRFGAKWHLQITRISGNYTYGTSYLICSTLLIVLQSCSLLTIVVFIKLFCFNFDYVFFFFLFLEKKQISENCYFKKNSLEIFRLLYFPLNHFSISFLFFIIEIERLYSLLNRLMMKTCFELLVVASFFKVWEIQIWSYI